MKSSIFVLSHGNFCQELVNSAEFIYGVIDNIYTFPLEKEVSLESYMGTIEKKINEIGGNIIFLTDIFGGTPSNVSTALIKKYGFLGFTGMSMPMLIYIVESISQEKSNDEILNNCKKIYDDSFHILTK
ncbi:PTS sugar transporter subunit IIA [Lactobacillus sp. ESL0791]|uniref:PTS sugar transporter subunit IIA n=1 Tax=Lactobacillus sp. ESL0791 TaxID=2983234 RepID=UPI0023F93C7D|nr:PTS sugar transporter subunit IIA [Lactobacillus sp. ESL0791]MDF7639649.1 PTS sugar transporter subunit IIA [Lactobacillus sp. ESL0791]